MTIVVLLVLLSVSECSSSRVEGVAGQSITLPCRYDSKHNGARPVCWNRGAIPNSGCNNLLISTDGKKVIQEASGRFQLLGQLEDGDVSLSILNLSESDAGQYGCRVDIYGWFNDEKHHFDLTVEKAAQTTTEPRTHRAPTAGPTHSHTTGQLTSTDGVFTSSSSSTKAEQESSRVTVVLVLVLFGLIALMTAGGVLFIMRRWRRLNKVPQQQTDSPVVFSSTSSTLQLHRRESAVDNIYQIDGGDGGEYEYCP
uniref:hepatitis A virus cellular receptor 1 homolog isoform X2 n=1 Tax=Semicossyphus pulcher TaxID=241346 RepID=UPI0037E83DE8